MESKAVEMSNSRDAIHMASSHLPLSTVELPAVSVTCSSTITENITWKTPEITFHKF